MEDMKRQKEEKKAYNLASGKNVDIDFEIMIDKSRFKEKILSPHVYSSENKVLITLFSLLYALGKDLFLRKNSKLERLIPSHAPILKSEFTSLNTKSME